MAPDQRQEPRGFAAAAVSPHLKLAQTQLTLGDAAQARATIQRVAADHPDFGGAELQARFRELLAACDQSTGAKK